MNTHTQALLTAGYLMLSLTPLAHGQGTAFTYQGRLDADGEPAAGNYELRFAVYDASNGGNLRGLVTNAATVLPGGGFATSLDFGFGVFNGGPRWIEIALRTNRSAAFVPLTPRQPISPTPYAIYAANAAQAQTLTGTLPASGLNGVYSNPVSFTSPANGFAGDGQGLRNVNAAGLGGLTPAQFWQTGGNVGTGNANFLGTTDNQALEFRVNGRRAWRVLPGGTAPNLLGGFENNTISNGVSGAVVGGGGGVVGGSVLPNRVSADFASVFGGLGNVASGVASTAFGNQAHATAPNSTAFGSGTLATNDYAVAMGGASLAGGVGSTAGGLQTRALGIASVALGYGSMATNDAGFAAGDGSIAGGDSATALGRSSLAQGDSSVAAGWQPQATGFASVAMGSQATATNNDAVALGRLTLAGGSASTALGYRAKALHRGSFVWADQQEADFSSTHANQMAIRAKGGVLLDGLLGIGNTTPFYPLEIRAPQAVANLLSTNSDFGSVLVLGTLRTNGSYHGAINFNDATDGTPGQIAYLKGDVLTFRVGNRESAMTLNAAGTLQTAGPVNPPSDRYVKRDFAPIDPQEILGKVASIPIQSWVYTNDITRRHIGPVAQDFHSAFGYNGQDDKHIATVDADGVALAAIQGLNQKLEAVQRANEQLRSRLEKLEQMLLIRGVQ